jgi:type I restriction enzyme, S subunit
MRHGRIDIRDTKAVPLTLTEAAPFLVRKGDVFIMRGNGSKHLCGQAGLATEDGNSVIFPDLFIRVPLPTERILPEFFVLIWNSAATREVIEEKAKTTSGIWKVNQGHICSTEIPLPPLPEQHRIVVELNALQTRVDTLKKLQAKTAAELDALLPSILDRAFKGAL